jgi:hypothetical protein
MYQEITPRVFNQLPTTLEGLLIEIIEINILISTTLGNNYNYYSFFTNLMRRKNHCPYLYDTVNE